MVGLNQVPKQAHERHQHHPYGEPSLPYLPHRSRRCCCLSDATIVRLLSFYFELRDCLSLPFPRPPVLSEMTSKRYAMSARHALCSRDVRVWRVSFSSRITSPSPNKKICVSTAGMPSRAGFIGGGEGLCTAARSTSANECHQRLPRRGCVFACARPFARVSHLTPLSSTIVNRVGRRGRCRRGRRVWRTVSLLDMMMQKGYLYDDGCDEGKKRKQTFGV